MAALDFSRIEIGRLVRPVSTMAEASALFRSRVGNRGASTMPTGWLINDAGDRVGHVSYNGRVWAGTPQEWKPGKEPLYCPSITAAQAQQEENKTMDTATLEMPYSAANPHRSHTLADWQYEVTNGDTARGYDEWVKAQIEAEEGDD